MTPVQIDIPPLLQRHVAEQVVLWDFKSVESYLSYLVAIERALESGEEPVLRETALPDFLDDAGTTDRQTASRIIDEERLKLAAASGRMAALPMRAISLWSPQDLDLLHSRAALGQQSPGDLLIQLIRGDTQRMADRQLLLEAMADPRPPVRVDPRYFAQLMACAARDGVGAG